MRSYRWRGRASLALLLGLACGCTGKVAIGNTGDGGDTDHGDAGVTPPDATEERDAGNDGLVTSTDGDTSNTTLLQSGAALLLFGVTSDGYAIYAVDVATPTLLAAPLTGGAPTTLGTVASESFYLTVQGSVVFLYDNITTTGTTTLKTWSSGGALQTITTAAFEYSATIGPDGKTVAYFDNFQPTTLTADAYIVQTDGSAKQLLRAAVPGIGVSAPCSAELLFAGSSVGLGYCTSTSPDYAGSVYTYSPPSWSETDVVDNVYPFFTPDSSGTNLLLSGATEGLNVAPVAGGTVTTLDPIGQGGLFTSDGSTVVYATTTGEVRSSTVASPSPTTLVAGGAVEGILGLSPDNGTALAYKTYNSSSFTHDLYASPAKTVGSLSTLNTAETSSQLFGGSFTEDSSHVFFWSDVGGDYLGSLQAASTTGGAPTTLGTASNTAWATTGSTLVFADNASTAPGSSIMNVDIEVVDLATAPITPVTLVTQINSSQGSYAAFYLNAARTLVVFTANAGNGLAGGLYLKKVSP